MSDSFDVIIIGAGHNGLVCANRLSDAGRRVLVLEANATVGGLAVTREFAPGFKVSAAAHWLYGLHPVVAENYLPPGFTERAGSAYPGTLVTNTHGEYINLDTTSGAIGYSSALSGKDNNQWQAFQEKMNRFAGFIYSLSDKIPPRLKNGNAGDYKTLAAATMGFKKLDKQDRRRFLQMVGMNIHDLVEESLESDLLKAVVCFEAILGTRLGPRAPNTVFNWLNRRALISQQPSGPVLPAGGMGAVSDELARTAIEKGVVIRTDCRAKMLEISNNHVHGVVLENGDICSATTVVSNADLKHTMLDLAGPENLDTDVVRRVSHVPSNGSTAKIHIALDRLPQSPAANEDFHSRIIFAPDPHAIELASNALKYREFSDQPVFEICLPSVTDPSCASPGKHVMSVLVPYVPYEHNLGWDTQKPVFENAMLSHIERLLPGTRSAVTQVEILLPADIEREFNVTGGHWHHCEPGLERFFMLRPVPGFGQYRTSIDGLFLCGADCHPGGDVSGVVGLNAANAIIRHKKS